MNNNQSTTGRGNRNSRGASQNRGGGRSNNAQSSRHKDTFLSIPIGLSQLTEPKLIFLLALMRRTVISSKQCTSEEWQAFMRGLTSTTAGALPSVLYLAVSRAFVPNHSRPLIHPKAEVAIDIALYVKSVHGSLTAFAKVQLVFTRDHADQRVVPARDLGDEIFIVPFYSNNQYTDEAGT